ncbi:RHS repeat protein [Pseudomonas sp. PDM25]|uniref:RHS repeat protein n=1 Tax=Pseudomonas sp. PDM25 TaxID=2854772 RepID=UPI001C46D3A7|nr:RHS repeat domain-containing protein [Pseudomonas sp. PDM25]MBV7515712.1 hypothetical protein [Pseudomonas sp. PDM25]
MSDVSEFFSQATNFVSAVYGRVDPRTGLYGININSGHLVANKLMGPILPLVLSYSPISTTNVGLGVGVSFGMSIYEGDSQSGLLSLGSGERYRVESGMVQQKKLDSFRFNMDGDNYSIFHKDGGVEILTRMGNVCVPQQIFNSAGYSITLKWDFDNCDNVVLTSVSDDIQDMLSITYSSTKVDMRVLPYQSEGYTVSLYLSDGYHLTQVTSDAPGKDKPALNWTIDYTDMAELGANWGMWATSLTLPGGLIEAVQYRGDEQAQRFPDGSGLLPLPCVTLMSITDGVGLLSQTAYTYTDTNFLGYSSEVSWDSGRDNLYNASSYYRYGSTQTHTDEVGLITETIRTYNNYHLLVTQELRCKDCITEHATEYYIDESLMFDEQPSQYQLPKVRITTWNQGKKSRSERTTTTFDESGNPLTQSIISIDDAQNETPIQAATVWEYYSSGGESGCPAEPNGFTRFIKTKTVMPATLAGYSVSPQITKYSYLGLETPLESEAVITTALMIGSEELYSGSQLLSKVAYSYAEKTDTANDFGRLLNTEHTHHPFGEEGAKFLTSLASTWQVSDKALIEVQTLTACAQSVTNSRTLSLFTAQVLASTDALGVINEAAYDALGRVISVTTAKGTDYESIRTCEYIIEDTQSMPFSITEVDANNNRIRTKCNVAGKPVRLEVSLADDPSGRWNILKTVSYDTKLRPAIITNMDYIVCGPDANHLEEPIPYYSLVTEMDYDGWEQVNLKSMSDGQKHWSNTDPIAMTVTKYTIGGKVRGDTTVTTYNGNRRPIKIETYDAKYGSSPFPLSATPSSMVLQEYDGLNRLRKHTDELGRVTTYGYDEFGRVTTTTLPKVFGSPSPGTKITRSYSALSPLAWVTDIQVIAEYEPLIGQLLPPVSIGTQVYDELGRITQRISGGRSWTATYSSQSGSVTSPSSVTSPKKNTLNYQYVAELGGKLSRVEKSSNPCHNRIFTYSKAHGGTNKIVGALLTATITKSPNPKTTATNTYTLAGRLATEKLSPAMPLTRYAYTVTGKTTHYTDVAGETQAIEYDCYGRVCSVSNSDVTAVFSYDDLGRLQQWITMNVVSSETLTTKIEFDGLGREIKRSVTSSRSANSWELRQTWYTNHQLNTKLLYRNEQMVRKEVYTYDARNRLVNYVVSGNSEEMPADERGNRIRSQIITYDAYSNIKCIQSEFEDGLRDNMFCTYGNTADPCQLTNVAHSHSSYSNPLSAPITYDANGLLISDGMGRTFCDSGSVLEGYLESVTYSETGKTPRHSLYRYDANNRMIKQDNTDLYYCGTRLVNQVEGNNGVRLLVGPAGNIAQIRTGANSGIWLSGIDANGSVLSVESVDKSVLQIYGPHGEQGFGVHDER